MLFAGTTSERYPGGRQWRPGAWNIHPKLPRHLDGITLAMPWALISYSRSSIAERIKGLDKPFRAALPLLSALSTLIHPREARGFTSGAENKSLLSLSFSLRKAQLNELAITEQRVSVIDQSSINDRYIYVCLMGRSKYNIILEKYTTYKYFFYILGMCVVYLLPLYLR